MSLRMRDLQQILDKFTNGNKGTAISDCFIYMETDNGKLAEVGRIELQESRLMQMIMITLVHSYGGYAND